MFQPMNGWIACSAVVAAAATLAFPASAPANYFVDDFSVNTLDNYVVPSGNKLFWDDGAGIGGQSGRASVFEAGEPRTGDDEVRMTYMNPVFNFGSSGETSVTAEAMIYHNFPSAGSITTASLGLGTNPGTATNGDPIQGLWGSPSWWGFGVDLRHDSNGHYLRTYIDGGSQQHDRNNINFAADGAAAGWIKISLTLEWVNSDDPLATPAIDMHTQLQHFGADGTEPGDVLLDYSRLGITSSQLSVQDHDLYVGVNLRGRSDPAHGGAEYLGRLAVVPEPASLVLLGIGGLAMLGRRRRAD